MSATLSKSQIVDHQRVLACSDFYKGTIDGGWGAATDAADKLFNAAALDLRTKLGEFDVRSEAAISTLIIPAQEKAREFMNAAKHLFQHEVKILSGTRTYTEQDQLYAQGRAAPGRIVTHATGGHSNHNFGIAWDCGIFDAGHYYTGEKAGEEQAYTDLAHTIKRAVVGLEWGGDWQNLVDRPHYQLATGKTLTQIRTAFEAGSRFV